MKDSKTQSETRVVDFNKNWTVSAVNIGETAPAKPVMLPHDAMIEEGRSPDNPSGSPGAFFAGGRYVYEKSFVLPAEWENKVVTFEFEGAYRNPQVYINDQYAGGCAYGYSPFWISAEKFLIPGKENVVRVEVNNEDQPNSRWYSGSGIYRPVWMWVQNRAHILPEGVRITTLSSQPAIIRVETEHTGGRVVVEILDGNRIAARGEGDCIELTIPDARLWEAENPEQYQCRVTLYTEEQEDQIVVSFGIRTISWNKNGLFINGKETLLRGGCIHHDNGILGARALEEAERRKIRILKRAGYNAIRSSHNPASKALLKACDDYGMYVIDETWDMWYTPKNTYDYAVDFQQHYKYDIEALIKRDYNHPSVIFYSIGNEVAEPATEKGIALEKELVEYIHSLDIYRAVTCGFNLGIVLAAAKGNSIRSTFKDSGNKKKSDGAEDIINSSELFNKMASQIGTNMNQCANSEEADRITSPGLELLDIAGYNYASGRYPLEAEAHPNRVIYGSETFPHDIGKNWKMVKELPYLIGDFMWTAWDYLGETGIGAWSYINEGMGFGKPYPWLLADTGVFDILGNENAEAGYTRIVWGTETTPYIGVRPVNQPGILPAKSVWRGTNAIPSWAWSNCNGNKAIVEVYADAAKVNLFQNSQLVGTRMLEEMQAIFEITYEPGELTAVAYDAQEHETGRCTLESASGRISISVEPEKSEVTEGEIVFIPITMKGENGVVDCNTDQKLCVTVENGELLAYGSANPRTEECYHTGTFTTYYGRSLAVIYCPENGVVRVKVTGEQDDSETIAEILVSPKTTKAWEL